MATQHPGGTGLTDRGVELAAWKEGSRILDIGCGSGDTVAHLNELGMKAEGIDMNLPGISKAKEKHPGIDVKFGDGEFLDSYMSYTFDGITMESSLGLINMPDEALHEAYCVLKKGGRLIVGDLYEKNPDPAQMRAVQIEADRQSRKPHEEGDCEERTLKFVGFRFEGAFFKEPLIRQLEETGFQAIAFEDKEDELQEYLKEETLVSLNKYVKEDVGGRKRDIGYFLLAAVKPL